VGNRRPYANQTGFEEMKAPTTFDQSSFPRTGLERSRPRGGRCA